MTLNMKISKNQFFGFMLMFSAIMISPFYIFPNGFPQPAHVLMLIASIAIILINRKYCILLLKSNKIFVAFLCWVFSINFIYYLEYKENIFIVNSIYWLYGFLMLLAALCVFNDKWLVAWIKKLIWIVLFIVLVAYFSYWGNFSYWPRYEFFFNSPNQLAYFALCISIIYISVMRGTINVGLLVTYSLAVGIILITGSRSAYLAFIPVILILLYFAKGSYKKQFLLIFLPIVIIYTINSLGAPWHASNQGDYLLNDQSVITNSVDRLKAVACLNCESYIESQLQVRGYLRILDFPQYLLFGAGQGLDDRFNSPYEIHSSLVSILFYYGLVGLILFLVAVYKLFKNKMNILLLSPIFIYGLFTFGLRAPYFWLALGFMTFIPNIFDHDTNSTEPISSFSTQKVTK